MKSLCKSPVKANTVPNEYRIKYGLLPHVKAEFKEKNGILYIIKVGVKQSSRGKKIVQRMRSTKFNKTMTTEDVMEMTRGYRLDDKHS